MNTLSHLVNRNARQWLASVFVAAVAVVAAPLSHASTPIANAALISEVMSTQNSALTMVQRYDFGRNMPSIAFTVAKGNPSYALLVKALGQQAADALVREKVGQFAPKYQEQWNRNLASAYSAVYTEDELRSFAEFGPQSDHMADFNAKRGDVGSVMRDKSQNLLNDYITDAMSSAFRASSLSSDHASKD